MIKPLLSKKQIMRAVLSGLGLVFLLYFFSDSAIMPRYSSLRRKISALSRVNADLRDIERKRAAAPEMRRKIAELNDRRKILDKQLAADKNVPPLSRTISSLASQYKVSVSSVKIPPVEQIGNFIKADCSFSASGSYDGVKKFWSALAAEGCMTHSVKIRPVSALTPENAVKADFELVYYRYKEP
jgi:Pilus assembly protein, PilO.